jgi:hypothetical protein
MKIWELLTYKLIRVRKVESKVFPWETYREEKFRLLHPMWIIVLFLGILNMIYAEWLK